MWTYVAPLVFFTFTENNIVVSAGIILESDPLRCIILLTNIMYGNAQ